MKTRFRRSIVPLLLAFSFGNLFELDAALTERFKQLDTHGDGKLTAGDHTRTLWVGDLDRRYRIYLPAKYDASKPTPVVLVYHGGGGNPEGMIKLCGMNAKSDQAGFIVVYPFGTGRFEDSLLTFNGGECCGYAMQNNVDDVGFFPAASSFEGSEPKHQGLKHEKKFIRLSASDDCHSSFVLCGRCIRHGSIAGASTFAIRPRLGHRRDTGPACFVPHVR